MDGIAATTHWNEFTRRYLVFEYGIRTCRHGHSIESCLDGISLRLFWKSKGKKFFLMECTPTDDIFEREHDKSTLLILLSYLKQKSTYSTSIEPILLQLHKRMITENIGAALIRKELMNDPIGSSLLEFYLQESLRDCSLETHTEMYSTNVVRIEEVSCNDSELSEIMSHEHITF